MLLAILEGTWGLGGWPIHFLSAGNSIRDSHTERQMKLHLPLRFHRKQLSYLRLAFCGGFLRLD